MSRKAVERHRFPENLRVGEDTIFYYLLKHDGLTGKLNVYCNDDRPPTYVYDQSVPGVVREEIEDGRNWSWFDAYNEEVYKMEKLGLLHEQDLPELKINYPKSYKANVINLPIKTVVNYDREKGILAPLNSSDETITDRIKNGDFYYY
jgi:hypothetical protein